MRESISAKSKISSTSRTSSSIVSPSLASSYPITPDETNLRIIFNLVDDRNRLRFDDNPSELDARATLPTR